MFTPGPKGLWSLPMRIIGGPGTAKSDMVTQVAIRAGLHVKVVLASLREPTDFLGMQFAGSDGQMLYSPPDWVAEVSQIPYSVVFFDEINTCAPATQAALLRIVLDRVVGDVKLPKTVRIVAAQNSVEDAAGGYDLAPSLANRFGTLSDWRAPDVDAWVAWLLGSGGDSDSLQGLKISDPVAEERRVMESWHAEYARAAGTVAAFVVRKPALIHQQPVASAPGASSSWPSRRTWAMATRAMAASKIHGLGDEETDRYVGSFVGTAAVVELRSFITKLDLPDPADLLDGRIQFKHSDTRMDVTMSVLSACSALVVPSDAPRRVERSRCLWEILREVMPKASDVAWPTVKLLCSRGVGLEKDGGVFDKNAEAVLTRYKPMLAAAGLLGS